MIILIICMVELPVLIVEVRHLSHNQDNLNVNALVKVKYFFQVTEAASALRA